MLQRLRGPPCAQHHPQPSGPQLIRPEAAPGKRESLLTIALPITATAGWFTTGTEGLMTAMAAADDDMPSAAQVRAAAEGRETHPAEAHSGGSAGRLNWLRAAVLGANDGIVSVAGIVIGVAGATAARGPIFTAGLAGLVAGAVSMALGEYVSVSSQRDSELAQLAQENANWPKPQRPN
jgi:hypothetical protein